MVKSFDRSFQSRLSQAGREKGVGQIRLRERTRP